MAVAEEASKWKRSEEDGQGEILAISPAGRANNQELGIPSHARSHDHLASAIRLLLSSLLSSGDYLL